MELLKKAKRFLKGLKKYRGFTLPEVAAVVAITGTLAAIVVPVSIDQIEKGRNARAKLDVDAISQAIDGFFRDTGEWPDRTSSTVPDGVEVLRSGGVDANFALFATSGLGTNAPDPIVGKTTTWTTSPADSLVNHLTLDNPGGTTTTANDDYKDAEVNWNGPYMPQIFNDPWGRNYVVYARAFTEATDGAVSPATAADIYVWVMSGGPNEALETDVTSPILNNAPHVDGSGDPVRATVSDDIGKMMFKAREGTLGVE